MVKMNFTDKQTAFEYAMYMMLGSYFDKATCKNKWQEKKMFFQYQEQKEKQQYMMEDICIRYIENELVPNLPKKFWQQEVTVKFRPTSLDGVHDIQFHGKEYVLRVGGVYRGKRNTNMQYEVWRKDAEPLFFLSTTCIQLPMEKVLL